MTTFGGVGRGAFGTRAGLCTAALAAAVVFFTSQCTDGEPRGRGVQEDRAALTADTSRVVAERSRDRGVKTAMMGALLYLDDTQVRARRGWHSPKYDACGVGDGCLPMLPGTGAGLPLLLPLWRNIVGEWTNFIHIFPDQLSLCNDEGNSIVQMPDSNLFMAAAISYPLYFFDESRLRPRERVLTEVRALAWQNVMSYKRGDGFPFWPQLPGSTSDAPRVGPINMPMQIANLMELVSMIPGMEMTSSEWFEAAFDDARNPYGADVFGNVPNDADDSAVALAIQYLHHRFDGGPPPELDTLDAIRAWRDLDRTREDGRDAWKGEDSGAFLTWLKDETLPFFVGPETGFVPLGVNNVDCVVNANVLLTMGLFDEPVEDGVADACATMRRAVEQLAWEPCGLYYPQRMIFPYTLSRAWRDGGMRGEDMRAAMQGLLLSLLDEQEDLAWDEPERAGAFPGGADETYDLSTALGLAALLNIGADIAADIGERERYEQAVELAVSYLVDHQQWRPIYFGDTFDRERRRWFRVFDSCRTWDAGVYFSGSVWTKGRWKSEAYTVAIALEALTKYVLAYDLGGVNVREGRKLRVLRYAKTARRAWREFRFVVE